MVTLVQVVEVDYKVITQRVGRAGGAEGVETGMNTLMIKALGLMSFDSLSMHLSCLDAIGHAADTVACPVASMEFFASLKEEWKKRLIGKRVGILRVYFDLLVRLLNSFLGDLSVFIEDGEDDYGDNDDKGASGNVKWRESEGEA